MEDPFSTRVVNQEARKCGFSRRKARVIEPVLWCRLFVRVAAMRAPSLHLIGALFATVSAVAVHKRLKNGGVKLLSAWFARLTVGGSDTACAVWKSGRILVQDSTVITLPQSCRSRYPGAANQRGSQAQGRLQCVIDLLAGEWVLARLDGFRRNDQAAAGDMLCHVRAGDLLVRDLGYQSLPCWQRYVDSRIDLLSRLRFGLQLREPDSRRKVSLKKLLRKGSSLDMNVLLGEARVPVRLVAVPLSAAHAAHRRRVARRDRDKRLAHSREYYRQLGWALFITSVPAERLSVAAIAALYRLRWRIEIVFKAAKSHLWTRELPVRASVALIEALIWARLILCWLHLRWHRQLADAQDPPSLLRSAQIFAATIEQILPLPRLSLALLQRFTRHRKRPKPGFPERLADFVHAVA